MKAPVDAAHEWRNAHHGDEYDRLAQRISLPREAEIRRDRLDIKRIAVVYDAVYAHHDQHGSCDDDPSVEGFAALIHILSPRCAAYRGSSFFIIPSVSRKRTKKVAQRIKVPIAPKNRQRGPPVISLNIIFFIYFPFVFICRYWYHYE
jgi:hypothetical protein